MRYPLILAAIVGLVPAVAQADADLAGGKPTVVDNGVTLTASGLLNRLERNKDVFIRLEATGTAEARCTNPGGEQPPGQNPVFRPITLTGYATFSARHIQRGSLAFALTTLAPPRNVIGAPDCPNRRWRETIVGVKFTSFKLFVEQPRGRQVLFTSCICSEPTSNGLVPPPRVSCSRI